MSDSPAPDATPDAPPTPDARTEIDPPIPGADDLGDAGKKALDAMKEERNAAKAAAKLAIAESEALRAQIANRDKPAEEIALEAARREATDAATKAANARILRAELKTAAKGVLADPADALAFIDLSTFDVDDNGDVDSDALNDAITALLVKKPHLAAGKQNPFGGSADGGATPPPKPAATIPEQAAAALAAGDVRGSIALKTSQLKPLPV